MERRDAVEAALAHLPLMLTVEQTCGVLGIGRTLAYGETARYLATGGSEGIPAVRIGSAIRVPRFALVDLMLAVPPPAVASPIALHAVVPAPGPQRSRAGRSRTARSSDAAEVAQLPFAEPSGS